MLSLLVILVLSYLVGSIPGSVWVGRMLYKVDIRQYGSGNAGATNAFRVLGWKAGVLASVVDLGKGLLAAGVIAFLLFLVQARIPEVDLVVHHLVDGDLRRLGHLLVLLGGAGLFFLGEGLFLIDLEALEVGKLLAQILLALSRDLPRALGENDDGLVEVAVRLVGERVDVDGLDRHVEEG